MTKQKTVIDELLRDPEAARLFHQERVILEVTEGICEAMEAKGLSRADLSRLLGTHRSWVTQFLGGKNMSLRTLSDIAGAMGYKVTVKIEKDGND